MLGWKSKGTPRNCCNFLQHLDIGHPVLDQLKANSRLLPCKMDVDRFVSPKTSQGLYFLVNIRSFKYFLALTIPISVFLSLYLAGYWSFLTVVYAFGIVPIIEMLFPTSEKNMSEAEESIARSSRFYDALIYVNLPIQLGFLVYFVFQVGFTELSLVELIGKTLSFGLACGTLGINVAHELGHRSKRYEQWMAKSLLLSSLYMHFIIEHNRGHHKKVSTDEDPASSRLGESLYRFVPRSIYLGYLSAWNLEAKKLEKQGKAFWSIHNEMIIFTILQVVLLVSIFSFAGPLACLTFFLAACIGIFELETVNYIEHYGLRRSKKEDGRYERVKAVHSWNSNHPYGRIILYELTRHSDHHYQASRPYQILRHLDEAPQMPAGYPSMMMLALLPPAWFMVMDKRVKGVMLKG